MLTTLLIFWPFLAVLILLALDARSAKIWALAASLIELVFSLFLAVQFEPNAKYQFVMNYPWITSLGINFMLALMASVCCWYCSLLCLHH
jgi:NADH-quinone oxidoreductase subunit M